MNYIKLALIFIFLMCIGCEFEADVEGLDSTVQEVLNGTPSLNEVEAASTFFSFNDFGDEDSNSLNITNGNEHAQLNVEANDSVSSPQTEEIQLSDQSNLINEIKTIYEELNLTLVSPAQIDCEHLAIPAIVTIPGDPAIEVGKRTNSCDTFYDLKGEDREQFFTLLFQLIDNSKAQ